MADSQEYLKRKSFYDQLITVYGRKPVLEILEDNSIEIFRLHLAESNRSGGIIEEIQQLAKQRGVEIYFHNRQALSRISRNSKQDQGVACDIHCPAQILLVPVEKSDSKVSPDEMTECKFRTPAV